MKIIKPLLLPAIIACAAAGSQAQVITVAWRNKPPQQYIEDQVEKGILLERAKQVFNEAHLPARFVEEPAKRIWNNFKIGSKNYCSIGWYRIPERESLVQFSVVFHSDPPHTLLVGPAAVAPVTAHKTLASLLADSTLTLGVVDGVSYGAELDALINGSKNRIERSTTSPMIMAQMIGANRASYMFIDREDWEFLHDKERSMQGTVQIDLKGMPQGLDRYIVCSKDVAAGTMKKINQVLTRLVPQKKPEPQ
ncbi:MAG: transporter substrate-binding domain-containing protein [Pseudomonadota bacterium]